MQGILELRSNGLFPSEKEVINILFIYSLQTSVVTAYTVSNNLH